MTENRVSNVPDATEAGRRHFVTDAHGPPRVLGLHVTERPTQAVAKRLRRVFADSGLSDLGHKLLIIGPDFDPNALSDQALDQLGLVRAAGAGQVVVENADGELRISRTNPWRAAPENADAIGVGDAAHVIVRPAG